MQVMKHAMSTLSRTSKGMLAIMICASDCDLQPKHLHRRLEERSEPTYVPVNSGTCAI